MSLLYSTDGTLMVDARSSRRAKPPYHHHPNCQLHCAPSVRLTYGGFIATMCIASWWPSLRNCIPRGPAIDPPAPPINAACSRFSYDGCTPRLCASGICAGMLAQRRSRWTRNLMLVCAALNSANVRQRSADSAAISDKTDDFVWHASVVDWIRMMELFDFWSMRWNFDWAGSNWGLCELGTVPNLHFL